MQSRIHPFIFALLNAILTLGPGKSVDAGSVSHPPGRSQDSHCSASFISSILPAAASVDYAVAVAAGSAFGDSQTMGSNGTNLPEGCAVSVTVQQTDAGSNFSTAYFLPASWNSRFLAIGHGGFAGYHDWLQMGANAHYGFVTMSSNVGHVSTADDASWALNDPAAMFNWGYRAIHDSTVLAKQLIKGYYGRPPAFSYFTGCSTGGRMGLKAAQRYPDDFDGVLAGAPGWWETRLLPFLARLGFLNLPGSSPGHLTTESFLLLLQETVHQCDPLDGLADGIIMQPDKCKFDPEALLCSSDRTTACLSQPQLDTATKLMSDWTDDGGQLIFPALTVGAYLGNLSDVQDAPQKIATTYIVNMLLNDTTWDWRTFNDSLIPLADRIDPCDANADQFDMSAFQQHGGKVIHYQGLTDEYVPPRVSTYFHEQVVDAMASSSVADFYRLFLIPGLNHCYASATDAPWVIGSALQFVEDSTYGVPGFNDPEHNALLALTRWVETGMAPEVLIPTKFVNDNATMGVLRQRPACVYPRTAKYLGGDEKLSSSWICA